MQKVYYGTLTRMMTERNYFFIRDDESGQDIFTHVSAFVAKVPLPKGTRVQFHLVPNARKANSMMAADVEPIVPHVIAAQYSDKSGVL
jgi:cold shock CspA family protein